MQNSKTKIDKSGNALAKGKYKTEEEYIEYEYIFDDYRKDHLKPLTETTLELQKWLVDYKTPYYIAQRLKRKPQIIRKLKRFNVRLTQLQDVAGCRIIVGDTTDVSKLHSFINTKIGTSSDIKLLYEHDYRERGRDDSGYRALHIILERSGHRIELQIRSKIQHYWAESIERTSVIYGYHLKEQEGDQSVIDYFQKLSNILFEIEVGRELNALDKLKIDFLRKEAETVIEKSDKKRILTSYVNDGIINTLRAVQNSNRGSFHNWIMIFDWNSGAFVSWDIVDRDPEKAIKSYVTNEKNYPQEQGYEVVLVGASKISTIRETHSHYFGIEQYDSTLEGLDDTLISISRRMDIDVGARQILLCMARKKYWGNNRVSSKTLKNHYCNRNLTFDSSLKTLLELDLIKQGKGEAFSLNLDKKVDIAKYT
jgi:ppGpp synthetase/RelA/SpoT-type nucleotidyltranferase